MDSISQIVGCSSYFSVEGCGFPIPFVALDRLSAYVLVAVHLLNSLLYVWKHPPVPFSPQPFKLSRLWGVAQTEEQETVVFCPVKEQ